MYRYGIETSFHAGCQGRRQGLNCTVMELKHRILSSDADFREGLNCTVMELKHRIIRYINSDKRSLNCTVMELKQIIR